MWTMALVTIAAFGLLFAGMSIGLLRGRALKGSCGGGDGADCLCDAGLQKSCELRKVKDALERVRAERDEADG